MVASFCGNYLIVELLTYLFGRRCFGKESQVTQGCDDKEGGNHPINDFDQGDLEDYGSGRVSGVAVVGPERGVMGIHWSSVKNFC